MLATIEHSEIDMRAIRGIFALATVWCFAVYAAAIAQAKPDVADVLNVYADIAEAGYSDSLTKAEDLKTAVDAFLAMPNDDTLTATRKAWIAARVPYMQTEAFRFGNAIVDDWEGKVNSWPLDEGLIDYVDGGLYGEDSPENELYAANVIANKSLNIGGKSIDASKITKELIASSLHEAGEVEANVATGYHAIEFLLWGQDLNGTGAGAGNRPATDFDTSNCTSGNCDRRADYLRAVTELLIDDLKWIVKQWAKDGEARKAVLEAKGNGGLRSVFTGLGSLTYGELAGERMKLGLLLHDPEEEHDCFSDNTHNSHFYDVIGIRNVYMGRYGRADGSEVKGPSVSDLVRSVAPDADTRVRNHIDAAVEKFQSLVDRAESKERYDQMIGQGNGEGNAVVQSAIDALVNLARELERAIAALKLDGVAFEGSDSLDAPEKIELPAQ